MNNYKSILLMKLPYCTHPIFLEKDQDIRTKTTFRPGPFNSDSGAMFVF